MKPNTRTSLLLAVLAILFLDGIASATQPVTYTIGDEQHVDMTTTAPINFLTENIHLAFFPLHPGPASAWQTKWSVSNGGNVGTTRNRIMVQIYLVNVAPPGTSRYDAVVYVEKVDSLSPQHSTLYELMHATASARGYFEFYWYAGYLDLYGEDFQGNDVSEDHSYVTFDLGTQPTKVFSPVVYSSIDATPGYHGCTKDMIGYDNPGDDSGHVSIRADYSTDNGNTLSYAPLATHLSAPKCSLAGTNYPNGTGGGPAYSLVSWIAED